MTYFYSIKVLFSNFNLMWKQLLYLVICSLLGFGLLYLIGRPILQALLEEGLIEKLYLIIKNFTFSFNLDKCFNSINELIGQLKEILNFSYINFKANTIWFIIVSVAIIPYIISLSNYSLSECLYSHLSSNCKKPFTVAFIENFFKNLLYTLLKLIIVIPFVILTCYIVKVTYLSFPSNEIFSLFAPIIILIEIIALFTILTVLTSCWLPIIVSHNKNVFVSFYYNLKVMVRNFGRVLSNSLMVVITLLAFNLIFGVFAFIITVPISMLFINCYNMILYFTSTGTNFYADYDNIVKPKKVEETIKVSDIKNLL